MLMKTISIYSAIIRWIYKIKNPQFSSGIFRNINKLYYSEYLFPNSTTESTND